MLALPRSLYAFPPAPLFAGCLSALMLGSCGDPPESSSRIQVVPVETVTITESAPPPSDLFPGLVVPYREIQLSFEVAGRVTRIADVGDDVEGESLDFNGASESNGSIVAMMDTAPYERALKQAERRLEAAQAELGALRAELDKVLPARLASANSSSEAATLAVQYAEDDVGSLEATVDLARTTLTRNQELLPTGAVSDIAVRESATALNTAEARLAQSRTQVTRRKKEKDAAESAIAEAEGAIILQEARVQSQLAAIAEREQVVLDAKDDLQDCVLRAPFAGRITKVDVGEGSFVQPGSSIMTITMLNPVEIQLTVSAAVEEELALSADATVYPVSGGVVDLERGLKATIFQKSGIATTRTRTFGVGLIAPNKRRSVRPDLAGVPTTPYLLPALRNPLDLPGNQGLFVIDRSVAYENDEPYVFKVQGLRRGELGDIPLTESFPIEKIAIQPTSNTIKIASFLLVEIEPSDSLRADDLLVAEPTDRMEDQVVLNDNRWLLRPGDLVQVSMGRQSRPSGFYVPIQAIQEINGDTRVFLVDDENKARLVRVRVHDSAGELRRIEGAELFPGASVVSKGTHSLTDGDTVLVTSTSRKLAQ